MDINATLLGQMITFVIFVLITMKWIWPLFKQVLDAREKKIADGLAAASAGHRELERAGHQAREIVHTAKQQASTIVADSKQRANRILECAKEQADIEAERILAHGRSEIALEVSLAREKLRQKTVTLAVLGAEKILQRQLNERDSDKLLAEVVSKL